MKTKSKKVKMQEKRGGEHMSKKEKIQIGKISMTANRGITLIALVVTIVVLIILATISINAVLGENGIIAKAQSSKEWYNNGVISEEEAMNELFAKADKIIGNGEDEAGVTEVKVTLSDGSEVTLTKENVADYLGKKVANYTGQEIVRIGEKSYIVSPIYRLYYVDFDNKYKDGAGTIYLKAECTSNGYGVLPTDESSDTDTNIKIKKLNPSLYAEGVTSPSASNNNMKVVTWLTNANNWSSLADTSMSNNINYIVGSPSLEMMIDSYNIHYKLEDGELDKSTLDENSARVKLFYQYPYTGYEYNYGYGVGPSNYSAASNGYYSWTSYYTVKTDSDINSMYYPGDKQRYWLSSPGATGDGLVFRVDWSNGGWICSTTYDTYTLIAFCPVVSLKPSTQLQLQ